MKHLSTLLKPAALVTVAALALAFAAGPAAAADPLKPWSGSRAVVKTKHLVPALRKEGDYWDKYTFNATFPNGKFYVSLAVGDALSDDKKLESKGHFKAAETDFSWKNDIKEGQWSHTTGEAVSIVAGKAEMAGTPQSIVFKNETDGGAYELTFTPIAQPWRPRGGQVLFGADKSPYDVTLFPLMKVVGKYKRPGGEWQNVEGRGFGSHVWGDLAPYDMNRWTLEFRAISGDCTVYMRELNTTEDYDNVRVPFLLITKGNEILLESFDYTFTATETFKDEKHDNKYEVPTAFTLQGFDDTDKTRQFRAVVKQTKLNKRKDYLADLGAFKAAVAGRFAKPVLYDYDTEFTFEVKTATGLETIKVAPGGEAGRLEINWLNK